MEKATLHRRQRQLLSLLRSRHGIVTSSELAAQMELSDRTIRNDVKILNPILEQYGAKIETVRGKGLRLLEGKEGPSPLDELLYSENTVQTREDRVNNLLIKLLFDDRGCQADELEDEMFVSRTTLEGDIRYIRKIFSTRLPHLTLAQDGHRFFIKAPEWKKRLMLTKMFVEVWNYQSEYGIRLQDSPLDAELFQHIWELAKAAVQQHLIVRDDHDLIAFTFTLAIAEFRIRTGHPLDEMPELAEPVPATPAIQQLIDDVERISGTRFNEKERENIMLSVSFRNSPWGDVSDHAEILRILGENPKRCTQLFLECLAREYGADFLGDEQLFEDLTLHIYRLEKRLRYGYERKNVLLSIIKTRYIYFFELSMAIHDCFQSVYDLSFGEDEQGYFAEYLIAAMGRIARRQYPKGIPTAFVSHLRRSDSDVVMSEMKAVYGNTLDLLGPFSIYDKGSLRQADPRLILSTTHTESVHTEMVHIPHITIPLALNKDVFFWLNLRIKEIHEQLLYKPLPQAPIRYFKPDLFFADVDLSNDTEVISFITRQMAAKGYAPLESTADALAREKCSSTAMDNGVALPRLRVKGPFPTAVAAVQLHRSIRWGGQRVGTVFFLSVAREDLPIFGTLLNFFSDHILQPKKIKNLLSMETFEELSELILGE